MKSINQITAMLVCVMLSACMNNNAVQDTELSTADEINNPVSNNNSMAGTRHVLDGGGDWTDTPVNSEPPVLDTGEPTTNQKYCAQSGMTIIADEEGCRFSIEEYRQGEEQVLGCKNGKVTLNGTYFAQTNLLGYRLSCQ